MAFYIGLSKDLDPLAERVVQVLERWVAVREKEQSSLQEIEAKLDRLLQEDSDAG